MWILQDCDSMHKTVSAPSDKFQAWSQEVDTKLPPRAEEHLIAAGRERLSFL